MKSNVWRLFVFVVNVVTEVGIARAYSKQLIVFSPPPRAVHPRTSGVSPFKLTCGTNMRTCLLYVRER